PIARRTCRFPGSPGARGARARWRSAGPLRLGTLWKLNWSLIRTAQSLSRSNIARLLPNLILSIWMHCSIGMDIGALPELVEAFPDVEIIDRSTGDAHDDACERRFAIRPSRICGPSREEPA